MQCNPNMKYVTYHLVKVIDPGVDVSKAPILEHLENGDEGGDLRLPLSSGCS